MVLAHRVQMAEAEYCFEDGAVGATGLTATSKEHAAAVARMLTEKKVSQHSEAKTPPVGILLRIYQGQSVRHSHLQALLGKRVRVLRKG